MAVEGFAPFAIQGITTQCHTWYKVFGDLTNTTQVPLVALHGGPAAGHDYLLGLRDLKETVIFYDQLGCGQSTDLPEKHGDKEFWSSELFSDEFNNLIAHLGLDNRPFDLLGHSWGGMLAAEWASDPARAGNLRRLVLYGAPASIPLHVQGLIKVRESLPQDAQEAIQHALDTEDYDDPAFKDAMLVFSQNHLSLSKPFPHPDIAPALARMATSEVHHTMFGPVTLVPSGSLQNWSIIPRIHQIKAPVLMISGSEEYIQESVVQPYFDHAPKVKWITFNDAAHFAHIEQPEKFFSQVGKFLAD